MLTKCNVHVREVVLLFAISNMFFLLQMQKSKTILAGICQDDFESEKHNCKNVLDLTNSIFKNQFAKKNQIQKSKTVLAGICQDNIGNEK